MVVSIAMLGIGASGTALFVYPKLKPTKKTESVSIRIGLYGLLLGVGITLSYIASNQIPFDPVRLSWDRTQLSYICLYYLILSIPFFFFGLSVSTVFSCLSSSSGLFYGSDLLGAGTGSIVLLYLMKILAPEHSILLVSSVALTGAILNGDRKVRLASVLLILLNASILLMPTTFTSPRMSPYKGLELALQYPESKRMGTFYSPFSRIDVFRSPAARFAPGLSLRYLDALPEQIGVSTDGGDINAVTFPGDEESLRFLKYLPSALPYVLNRDDNVLILEPKGGLEALLARYYGAGNIYRVDSNPLMIEVIRGKLRNFSQGIYEAGTWTGLGRSWLRKRVDKFDIIDIPLMGASASGSFGITEDYRFTVEAFREYMIHLKNDGVLSVHLFIIPPPRVELRLLNTLIASMKELGMQDIDKKIIAIRSWGTICILAKRVPFTAEQLRAARNFSREMRFDLLYLPGITEEETNVYVKMPSNEYFRAFSSILDPVTRESFQHSYIFDISPVYDENPFFHYYLKLKNIVLIYGIMGGKWQYFMEEGYLLPVVFAQILVLSAVLILLPVLIRRHKNYPDKHKLLKSPLLYFASLGLGFMFVEISLMQKMILPLENPPYAVAAVLTSLLIGSGIGSLLSEKVKYMRSRFIIVTISLLIIVYSLVLPTVSDIISSYPIQLKIACMFIFLTPLSILMGVAFPLGIRNLGVENPDMVPMACAMNGYFSVLAPIIAVMLAITIGFKAVLWMGAGTYLLAFFTFPETKKEPGL